MKNVYNSLFPFASVSDFPPNTEEFQTQSVSSTLHQEQRQKFEDQWQPPIKQEASLTEKYHSLKYVRRDPNTNIPASVM